MYPKRKHIRLRNFDYSTDGYYFITICTKYMKYYFGEIELNSEKLNAVLSPSAIGKITEAFLLEIPVHFPHTEIDEYVVMPNHIHCILILKRTINYLVTQRFDSSQIANLNQFSKPVPGSVSVIIQQFKSSVKRWCNKNNHEYFRWHSKFHDHIIRNEAEYKRIKQYIINNPAKWRRDKFLINK